MTEISSKTVDNYLQCVMINRLMFLWNKWYWLYFNQLLINQLQINCFTVCACSQEGKSNLDIVIPYGITVKTRFCTKPLPPIWNYCYLLLQPTNNNKSKRKLKKTKEKKSSGPLSSCVLYLYPPRYRLKAKKIETFPLTD